MSHSFFKPFYLLVLSALPFQALAANPCDQVFGEWHGKATQKHTFHTCEWDVDAIFIHKEAEVISFQLKYYHPNHHLCGIGYTRMQGTCMNGELWFASMMYHGNIIGNQIKLEGGYYHYTTFDLMKAS